MRRAAIVAPVRTPVGRFGGALRHVSAAELAEDVIRAVLARTSIDPERIDDVVFAQSYPNGEAPCVGRFAALQAGLPIEVPGMHLDRRCAGGLQAVTTAAMMVLADAADVVVAGGVESMSNVEFYARDVRWGVRAGSIALHDRLQRARERSQPEARFGRISGMIETAETLAREHGITRAAADEYSARSHERAAAAWAEGRFASEIVPVSLADACEGTTTGGPDVVDRDEGIRPDTTVERLGKLQPIIENGTVTAGNASQQNDAAAACLVVAEDKLDELELEPLGYLVGSAVVGCHPARMGLGPVPAVEKVFGRTGLSFDDMELVELNEAFACQVLAVLKLWNWNDSTRLNVNGSGISLGHPVGATGVRILATLLNELKRREGRYGLETMCVGGGQGMAAIFERAS